MAFKMKIQEISIKTQSVEKFSKDLQSISAGILNGTAVWWKNCHGAQMLSGLQDILVEREFAFLPAIIFMSGRVLNASRGKRRT